MEKELVNYIWNALKIIYGYFTSGKSQKCKLQLFYIFFLYISRIYVKIPFSSPKSIDRKKVERNRIKNWFHFEESTSAEKIPHEKFASKPRMA
jgi:hypothetical protein